MLFARMVLAARLVVGIFYLLSGLNWFFGFIPMLPSIHSPPDLPIKHAVVVEMIGTGWMFQSAKVMELLFGAALLANRFVPAMLAAALPVAFITFMLDALILDDLWRWIQGTESSADLLAAIADMIVGGLCVLLPHLWLMWCYRDYYRPALAWVAHPRDEGDPAPALVATPSATVTRPGWTRTAFLLFGGFAILLQAYNLYLFVSMVGKAPPPRGARAASEAPPTGDLRLSYDLPEAGGERIPYRLFVPKAWTPETKPALVVVLHGYGGNADSPFADAGGVLQREAERHGFLVLSPNGYSGMVDYGANLPLPSALARPGPPPKLSPQAESALAEADVRRTIDRVVADYGVDPRRIYLMGNSMGMTGVLHLARTTPGLFCAISASGGPPWRDYPVESLRGLAGALFVHGARDDRADPADTRRLAERARAAGVDARMELIAEGTHGDAWIRHLPQTLDFFAGKDCRGR